MLDFLKEIKEWDNLPEDVKQNKLFVKHLNYYNQPQSTIRIAENISFKGILELFDVEFDKLWEKMALPPLMEEYKAYRETFRDETLKLMRQNFFYFIFKHIKDLDENTVDYKKLNSDLYNLFNHLMGAFFRASDLQFQLSSLNENNDPKVIFRDVVRKNQLAKQGEKFQGKSYSNLDKHWFEKVYEEYEKQEKNGDKPSYRKVALKIADNQMGNSHPNEADNFYKRFIHFHRKNH